MSGQQFILCCGVLKVDFEKNCGDDSECISSLTVRAETELPRLVHSQ